MLADAGTRDEFAFWESNVSSTNVIDFWVEPKGEGGAGTSVNFGVGFLGATQLWSADFVIGKWHQVAIHVHWSTNPKLGSVDVWFDGKQVVTAYAFQTKPDANTLFYQNGLHRKVQENFVDTIYIDDFIEADTFAEAQIAAPIDSDSDGGGVTSGPEGGAVDGGSVEASAGTADSGMGATSGANEDDASATVATAGSGGASGASSPSGRGASGAAVGTSGTASGESTSSGFAADHVDSGSKSGCAVSGMRARPAPFASVLAILGLALAGRRRARRRESRKP